MEYSNLNRYQTPLTIELEKSLPKEVYSELLNMIESVPLINWLVQSESIRGYASDRPKHIDLDDSDDRKQYVDNRIVVDVTKPHILDNIDFFRERAIFYDKYGVYTSITPDPNPSSEWGLFWKEELRRWKDGLIRPSDGEWIPGGLYFYWNYSPIWLVEEEVINIKGKTKTRGKRVRKFPKPWLGDYLFYHYMEQGREAGQHGKLLKARGLGFSFKMGSLSPRNMYVYQGSGNPNFHLASDKTFLSGDKGVFGKVVDVLDWIADTTPLPKLRLTNSIKSMEIQLGYQDEYGVRRGPQSSVYGISLKDNADKARGIRGPLIHYEEDGLFPNLEDAWNINRKAVEDGDVAFGYMLAGGTGGVEGASFEGSEKLFYNPGVYNIYGISNVYDINVSSDTKCGFFWGAYLNRNKCYDLHEGEPDVIKAMIEILNDRHKVKYHSTDPKALTQKKAEEPITPQEAIMRKEGNVFPAEDIKNYLAEIMPNFTSFVSSHYVGKLMINTSGEVEWKLAEGNLYPIRDFPFLDGNKEGAVEIYEMPKRFGNGEIPQGRFIVGCLTPGEKVMTDIGLVNVEDVTFDRKLINENGDLVPVKTIYNLHKENEDIYTVKMSNSFRTTSFTSEHPILSCTTKMNYHGSSVCKKLNIPQRERTFNFEYKPVKDLKLGDYVKVPNIYKKENNNIEHYWEDNGRIDRQITNPLLNKDFWWFVGVWLGDGYSFNYTNAVVFNSKETQYIERFTNLVNTIFKRKCSVRIKDNATEVSFAYIELTKFMHKHFGRYSYGKRIPEWAKYISKEFKKELISGYLASDGCIVNNSSQSKTTEFVSINLEMLEGIQDILFSLGLISSLQKLRDEAIHIINGKPHNTKVTYSLRIGHTDTLELGRLLNWYDSHKLSKLVNIEDKEDLNKTVLNCFFVDNNDYIYFKVKDVVKSKYTGIVYNFECDTHTFMCRYITTHNCDPYDDETGTSLGSVFVFDRWARNIVAEYTGRPRFADEFYEICYRLAKYYNALIMYENNKKGLFVYFRNKNLLHMLADVPKILTDKQTLKPDTLYGNKAKGFNATAEVNIFLRTAQVKWMCEPLTDDEGNPNGLTRLHKIRSIPYLKECASWNSDGNFDRVSAMGAVMLYDLELGNIQINKTTEQIKTRANDRYFDKFYGNRSKMLNSW